MENGRPVRARRLVIRAAAAAALIASGFWMYGTGREFEVMIDNGAVTVDGVRYEAMAYGTVVIDGDGKNGFDMWAGDRVIKKMVGANHRLTVKALNEDDESVIKTDTRDIVINFKPKAEMVSISAILGGAQNILTPNPLHSPDAVFTPETPQQAPVSPDGGAPGHDMPAGMTP